MFSAYAAPGPGRTSWRTTILSLQNLHSTSRTLVSGVVAPALQMGRPPLCYPSTTAPMRNPPPLRSEEMERIEKIIHDKVRSAVDSDEFEEMVAGKVRNLVQRPEAKGFRKFLRWLREWSLVGAVITVFVALVGIVVTLIIFSVSGSRTEAEFRGKTDTIEGRLTGIEGVLKVLQAQTTAAKFSTASPQELKSHRIELALAKSALASAPRNVPSFWPISFQIIELVSQSTSGIQPSAAKEGVLDNVSGLRPPIIVYPAGSRLLLKNQIADSVFQNVVIRFDPSVRLVNVTFINCVFILPSDPNPPQNIQKIGEVLLASDLSRITITS